MTRTQASQGETGNPFFELFKILKEQNLFADGPRMEVDLKDHDAIKKVIEDSAQKLPGLYQDPYVWPLLRNLKQTLGRNSTATMEALAGAVYDHTHPSADVTAALRGLLSVISNVYRSFLTPEHGNRRPIPEPKITIPSLVMFRPKLYLNNDPPEYGPSILPANEVQRLCGGTVGVACIPSNYRMQPALCWAVIAHEVGGHDVLNSYDGLLWELKNCVRQSFYKGNDPYGEEPESMEQFLGILWEYWTEEAASDVCAIMNLGPAYAMGAAVYLAALNNCIQRLGKDKTPGPDNKPFLTTSWPPRSSEDDSGDVNTHPTDLCKLYLMIGAIEGLLGLNEEDKERFTDQIKEIIQDTMPSSFVDTSTIQIRGWIQFKPGRWVRVKNNAFPVNRKKMEECAYQVGKLIATTPLQSLNGNCIQHLETWDSSDQSIADQNSKLLLKDSINESVGDDAQLIAGAILALFERPQKGFYELVNKKLLIWLTESFDSDPIWREVSFHPIVSAFSSTRKKRQDRHDR